MSLRAVAWITVHVGLVTILASRLPPDAWFVGDPGVKLIAAWNVLRHPHRPFEIPKGPAPADIAQPFLVAHDDHVHAITSPVFPALTAPLLALFGLRGLYVLPALGWVLTTILTVRFSRAIGARGSTSLILLCGIIGSPLLFYGLEFWEHAPATAAVVGAAVIALHPAASTGRLAAA